MSNVSLRITGAIGKLKKVTCRVIISYSVLLLSFDNNLNEPQQVHSPHGHVAAVDNDGTLAESQAAKRNS